MFGSTKVYRASVDRTQFVVGVIDQEVWLMKVQIENRLGPASEPLSEGWTVEWDSTCSQGTPTRGAYAQARTKCGRLSMNAGDVSIRSWSHVQWNATVTYVLLLSHSQAHALAGKTVVSRVVYTFKQFTVYTV
jgi:hypothetical protein